MCGIRCFIGQPSCALSQVGFALALKGKGYSSRHAALTVPDGKGLLLGCGRWQEIFGLTPT
jgi:hypothetical protein